MHPSRIIRCCIAFVSPQKQTGLQNGYVRRLLPTVSVSPPSTPALLVSSSLGVSCNQRFARRLRLPVLLFSTSRHKDNSRSNDIIDQDDDLNQLKKRYQISASGEKSFVSMTTNTGHTIQTDVPKQMGGTDKAPQPVETLLAAWIGCTQATALFVARNMMITTATEQGGEGEQKVQEEQEEHGKPRRIFIDRMDFDVAATRDERGALSGELPITNQMSQLPTIPARLEKVQGVVKVYAKERRKGDPILLSDEELSILGKQTETRCPVANMMALSGCEMDIKWING